MRTLSWADPTAIRIGVAVQHTLVETKSVRQGAQRSWGVYRRAIYKATKYM